MCDDKELNKIFENFGYTPHIYVNTSYLCTYVQKKPYLEAVARLKFAHDLRIAFAAIFQKNGFIRRR